MLTQYSFTLDIMLVYNMFKILDTENFTHFMCFLTFLYSEMQGLVEVT